MARLEALLLAYTEAEAYYVQSMSLYADLTRHFAAPRAAAVCPSPPAPLPASGERGEELLQPESPATAFLPSPRLRGEGSGVRGDRPSRRILGMLAVAALAASVALVMVLTSPSPKTKDNTRPEAVDNTVAVLLRTYRAEWEPTGLPTRVGAALPPGWLRLKSGFAHIEFYSGAV